MDDAALEALARKIFQDQTVKSNVCMKGWAESVAVKAMLEFVKEVTAELNNEVPEEKSVPVDE